MMAPSPSSSSSPSTHPILPVMRKLSNSTKYRQDQSRTSLPTKPELRRSTWPVTVDQARSLRKTRHPRKRRTPGLALMHIRYHRYACPLSGICNVAGAFLNWWGFRCVAACGVHSSPRQSRHLQTGSSGVAAGRVRVVRGGEW